MIRLRNACAANNVDSKEHIHTLLTMVYRRGKEELRKTGDLHSPASFYKDRRLGSSCKPVADPELKSTYDEL